MLLASVAMASCRCRKSAGEPHSLSLVRADSPAEFNREEYAREGMQPVETGLRWSRAETRRQSEMLTISAMLHHQHQQQHGERADSGAEKQTERVAVLPVAAGLHAAARRNCVGIFTRLDLAISQIAGRHRHGIPRCSQFETAGSFSPSDFATADVPPNAWMISASVMQASYSRSVNSVKTNVHGE